LACYLIFKDHSFFTIGLEFYIIVSRVSTVFLVNYNYIEKGLLFMLKILFIPLRSVLRFIRDFDGFFSTYTSILFKNNYCIQGRCHQCGKCCQELAIYLSAGFWRSQLLKGLIIKWFEFVYNFTYLYDYTDHRAVAFRCNYLKNNKCPIHWKRPFICRNYPGIRYFEEPKFLPGCGFFIAPQDAEQ
jgi:uncharacterized protein